MSLNLCECGCGQPTKLATQNNTKRGWVKGQPLRFIHNHHGRKPKIDKVCGYCEKPYTVKPAEAERTKYCCHKCLVSANNKARGRGYGELIIDAGRAKIKLPDHPYSDKRGYVYFYRYLIECHLGYPIDPKKYAVHHIDKDHTNDVLSNLVVMTHSAHSYLHSIGRPRNNKGRIVCYSTE